MAEKELGRGVHLSEQGVHRSEQYGTLSVIKPTTDPFQLYEPRFEINQKLPNRT